MQHKHKKTAFFQIAKILSQPSLTHIASGKIISCRFIICAVLYFEFFRMFWWQKKQNSQANFTKKAFWQGSG
jgi:hypothetical protein